MSNSLYKISSCLFLFYDWSSGLFTDVSTNRTGELFTVELKELLENYFVIILYEINGADLVYYPLYYIHINSENNIEDTYLMPGNFILTSNPQTKQISIDSYATPGGDMEK